MMANWHGGLGRAEMTLREQLLAISWTFVVLIALVSAIGFLTLYSAANGSVGPWASRQMARFAVGVAVMLGVAMVDIRLWMRWSYALYAVALALLVVVLALGMFFYDHENAHGAFLALGASALLLLGVDALEPRFGSRAARVIADAVLLVPLLIFLRL